MMWPSSGNAVIAQTRPACDGYRFCFSRMLDVDLNGKHGQILLNRTSHRDSLRHYQFNHVEAPRHLAGRPGEV